MKSGLLSGFAALAGLVSLAQPAHAVPQCSDLRNQARNTNVSADLNRLLIKASGCDESVVEFIQRRIDASDIKPTGNAEKKPVVPPRSEAGVRPNPPSSEGEARREQPATLLTVGQQTSGRLTAESATDERRAPYDLWRFHANQGQRLQIAMTSSSGSGLDTFLVLGRAQNGQFEEIDNDDDGGGSSNSALIFSPNETGEYLIRARAYQQGQYGGYTLVARELPPAGDLVTRPIHIGARVTGRLSPASAIDEDSNSALEQYSFDAQARQSLRISMTASDNAAFDTYVAVGRMNGDRFEELASNDDAARDNRNSVLRFVAPETGSYVIRARAFEPNVFGAYTLAVDSTSFTDGARTPITGAMNAWMRDGRLSTSAGGDHADFTFETQRRQRYRVHAVSGDFSPVIEIASLGRGGAETEVNLVTGDGPADTVDFDANPRTQYILRVSATELKEGHFVLVVTPLP